jgi:adenylate kinase family enzyme
MIRSWNGGPVVVGRRIVVVGTSASGKTTLARRLARKLHILHVGLDGLHWEPNWTEAPDEVFRERTLKALQGEGWSVDGNYSQVRDIVWSRADTVVWLDYPLQAILWRLTLRTFRRIFRREELWGGNRESLRTAFFSKDSLYVWVLTTYKRRRREYPQLFAMPEHAHLRIVRLTSPKAADAWLARVKPPPTPLTGVGSGGERK